MLRKLLVSLANLYTFIVCWSAYWLAVGLVRGVPRLLGLLARLGVRALVLVLLAVWWQSRAARDPKKAWRDVKAVTATIASRLVAVAIVMLRPVLSAMIEDPLLPRELALALEYWGSPSAGASDQEAIVEPNPPAAADQVGPPERHDEEPVLLRALVAMVAPQVVGEEEPDVSRAGEFTPDDADIATLPLTEDLPATVPMPASSDAPAVLPEADPAGVGEHSPSVDRTVPSRDELVARARALVESGLSQRAAALRVGLLPSSLRRLLQRPAAAA